MATSSETIDDEVNLPQLFEPAQNLTAEIEGGACSTKDIQPRLKKCIDELQRLTVLINNLGMFSSNELVEDVPTDSMRYLLIPCFLGICHENLIADPKDKILELEKAQIYFRSFMERVRNLTIIEDFLPWDDENIDIEQGTSSKPKLTAEQTRKMKLDKHRKKKELRDHEANIKHQLETVSPDDHTLRDLYITQIKYWCERALDELQSIKEELPLLKMMAERASNPQPPPPRPPQRGGLSKPFIITRDAAQKAVFGLGYPSVPTLTVDEWYQQRFGHGHAPPTSSMPAPPPEEAEDDSADEEEKRQQAIRMDEYKDTHRRGWGNTHNKG